MLDRSRPFKHDLQEEAVCRADAFTHQPAILDFAILIRAFVFFQRSLNVIVFRVDQDAIVMTTPVQHLFSGLNLSPVLLVLPSILCRPRLEDLKRGIPPSPSL